MDYNSIIAKANKDLIIAKNKLNREPVRITADQLIALFKTRLNGQMLLARKPSKYLIDDKNKKLISQMMLYLARHNECKLDLNKGILLIGNVGCGKTMLMKAFIATYNDLYLFKVNSVLSTDYVKHVASKDELNYSDRPLFIDDIGKEATFVNDYGTEVLPIIQLLAKRYNDGELTFGTANYRLDTLTDKYKDHITDRMKEMFNIVVLEGSSRR